MHSHHSRYFSRTDFPTLSSPRPRARSLYLFQWNSGWIIDSVIAIGETAARWGIAFSVRSRPNRVNDWRYSRAWRDVERHGSCMRGLLSQESTPDSLRQSSSPLLLILNASSDRRNAGGTEMNSKNSENLIVYRAWLTKLCFKFNRCYYFSC